MREGDWGAGWPVVVALVPAAAAGTFQFGTPALGVMALATAACAAAQRFGARARRPGRPSPGIGRAALVGLLLGMALPPAAPAWAVLLGAAAAALSVPAVRAVTGLAPLHPTAAGLALLHVALPGQAARWTLPIGLFGSGAPAAGGDAAARDLVATLVGRVPGGSGSTALLALGLGGAYLLARGVLDWRVPAAFLAGLAVPAALSGSGWIPGGDVALGALFVAADPACAPASGRGRLVFGAGCGVLTSVLRGAPGGGDGAVWFAITLAGLCVPLIEAVEAGEGGEAPPGAESGL